MFDPDVLRRAYAPPEVPWVRANFVSSLDGAATVGGRSGALNDPWDLAVFETLRALADVVVVGAGTVRAEAYDGVYLPEAHVAWRRARGLPDHPRLAIVTDSGNLDPCSAPFAVRGRKERPLVFAGSGAAPAGLAALEEVAEVIRVPGGRGVDAAAMVGRLWSAGLTRVLCEGGPTLFGALLAADLIDELCLTLSPLLVGGRGPRIASWPAEALRPMGLTHALTGGAMLFLRYGRLAGPHPVGAPGAGALS